MVFRLGGEIGQFFYHKLNADTVTIALGLGWGHGLGRRSRFDWGVKVFECCTIELLIDLKTKPLQGLIIFDKQILDD